MSRDSRRNIRRETGATTLPIDPARRTRAGSVFSIVVVMLAQLPSSPGIRDSAAAAPYVAPADHARDGGAAAFRLISGLPEPAAANIRRKPAISPRLAERRFAIIIDDAAWKASLDPALVHAVISVESGYNPSARSPKGAVGLMQVLPETAMRYGIADPAVSPEANLSAGTRYLSYLMTLFDNRIELVLAAYNAGENAVLRHGHRIPPFRETQNYVPAVLAKYREWREPETPAVPTLNHYMHGTTLKLNAIDKLRYRLAGPQGSGG